MNVTVASDDAVDGRFQVLFRNDVSFSFLTIDRNKDLEVHSEQYLMQSRSKKSLEVIDLYKGISDFFENAGSPIMEFKINRRGKVYFLQYHQARDRSGANFRLDREPHEGEVEAFFVCGATPSEGLYVNLSEIHNLFDVQKRSESNKWLKQALDDYGIDGIHLSKHRVGLNEYLARRSKLFIAMYDDLFSLGYHMRDSHLFFSSLFKPQVSIGMSWFALELLTESNCVKDTDPNNHFCSLRLSYVKVVSDGNRAYIFLSEA